LPDAREQAPADRSQARPQATASVTGGIRIPVGLSAQVFGRRRRCMIAVRVIVHRRGGPVAVVSGSVTF